MGTVVVVDNDGETVGIGGTGGAVEGNCGEGKLDREETSMSRFVTTSLSINRSTWQHCLLVLFANSEFTGGGESASVGVNSLFYTMYSIAR